MTEIKTSGNAGGSGMVQIADEVFAIIAGTAALEIDGVAGLAGGSIDDLAERLGRRNFAKGVSVDVDGNEITVSLQIIIRFGYKLPEVSAAVQERVKSAIETMTGLSVPEVNVSVAGVLPDRERRPEDEL